MIKVVNKYKHKPTKFDVPVHRGYPLGNPFTSIQHKNNKSKNVFVQLEKIQ